MARFNQNYITNGYTYFFTKKNVWVCDRIKPFIMTAFHLQKKVSTMTDTDTDASLNINTCVEVVKYSRI